jgi:tryptophanyl-tRNA synthetase
MRLPVHQMKKYDWIVSLEVAARMPTKYEPVFVDNLVRHAIEGMIVSWTWTGLDDYEDVDSDNGGGARDFEYVKRSLEARSFKHDPPMSRVLQLASSIDLFKRSINVFYRI